MANYAIMRIEKRKIGGVTKICNHHERLKEKYKSNPDIDTQKSNLNYHIKKPEEKYRPAALKIIEEAGAKRRKDSVIIQDCLVTASPQWINDLTYEKQVDFFNYANEYFANEFNEKNIISAVVHMDETNPHMHIVFVPLTKDNRLSSKDVIGGPRGLTKHQDKFYEHISARYPDLSRGISSKITHRKHIPTYVYKNSEMLMEHYEEIVNAISDIGIIGNAKKKDEAISLLGKYAPEMAQMKNQLKMTDKYIENLEKGIKVIEGTLDLKKDKIREQKNEIVKLKSRIQLLNHDQNKLMKVIEKIPADVLEKMKQDEKQRRKKEREAR